MVLCVAFAAILGLVGLNEQDRHAPLVVAVKASARQAVSSGIELTVEITNISDNEFKLNRTTKSPVFTLRLINEQGLDLNKDQFKNVRKDRSNKVAPPLIFKPHQTITYHVRLVKYLDEDGTEKKIRAGKYNISARLPVVSYEGVSPRVESIDSEVSTVTMQ